MIDWRVLSRDVSIDTLKSEIQPWLAIYKEFRFLVTNQRTDRLIRQIYIKIKSQDFM